MSVPPIIMISPDSLHEAMLKWVTQAREGKLLPQEETDKLSLADQAAQSTAHLWQLLGGQVAYSLQEPVKH